MLNLNSGLRHTINLQGEKMFNYRRATLEDLEKIWNKDIQDNLDDNRYIRWKE